MITCFKNLLNKAIEKGPKKIVVAEGRDEDAIKACHLADKLGISESYFVGNTAKIKATFKKLNISFPDKRIIKQPDEARAAMEAVQMVNAGEADVLMKGAVPTATLLKAVLNKQIGLRTNNPLSHVGVFQLKNEKKLRFISDVAMNVSPDLNTKIAIIKNAVNVAHKLGINIPKVALLTPFEKVYLDMQSTIDAALISKMNECNQIEGAIIEGPLALDNAISKKAAKIKNIKGKVPGNADIFITHDIEAGNVFWKALAYFVKARLAGIIAGAKAPIILASRADTEDTKLLSIALAIYTS